LDFLRGLFRKKKKKTGGGEENPDLREGGRRTVLLRGESEGKE